MRVLAHEPPPVHLDGAPVGHELPAEHVDEGGLAGSVRADDGPDLARGDLEVHPVEGHELPEALDEPPHLERGGGAIPGRRGGGHAARPRSRATTVATSPAIPAGETSTTRTRMTPMTSCQYSK